MEKKERKKERKKKHWDSNAAHNGNVLDENYEMNRLETSLYMTSLDILTACSIDRPAPVYEMKNVPSRAHRGQRRHGTKYQNQGMQR
jgi:hypothetical protein